MIEITNNTASTTYTLASSPIPQTVTSNTVQVNYDNTQGLTLTKTPNPTTFLPGDIITYTVTITNPSGNYYNGVRIIDDLGGGNLAYVVGSGSLSTSTQTYNVTPVATNPLTFTLQQLASGATMTLTYQAQVVFNLPGSVTSITNSVQGIGYTSNQRFNGYASSTIQKKTTSAVNITKSASASTVSPFQQLTYSLTATNGSGEPATLLSVVDQLPAKFNLQSVTAQLGSGTPDTLDPSEYSLMNKLFTYPIAGNTVVVPAGVTGTLNLTGYFSG